MAMRYQRPDWRSMRERKMSTPSFEKDVVIGQIICDAAASLRAVARWWGVRDAVWWPVPPV